MSFEVEVLLFRHLEAAWKSREVDEALYFAIKEWLVISRQYHYLHYVNKSSFKWHEYL